MKENTTYRDVCNDATARVSHAWVLMCMNGIPWTSRERKKTHKKNNTPEPVARSEPLKQHYGTGYIELAYSIRLNGPWLGTALLQEPGRLWHAVCQQSRGKLG